MATEAQAVEPTEARDRLLGCVQELRALDVGATINQVLDELKHEQRCNCTTWDDVVARIGGQEYTTYNLLHKDVYAVLSVLLIPDKKRSRLQKACAKVMKDIKKSWSTSELNVRMWLYAWHPGGPSKAHEVLLSQISMWCP